MTTYLVAIDGGATKTVVTLRDENGAIFYEGDSTGSNYQVIGIDAFKKVVQNLLQELLLNHPVSTINVGVFALAGIDTLEDYQVVKEVIIEILDELSLKIVDLIVENDAYSTLVGVTKNQAGILIISGTGSIAYAHDGKGIVARSGGWGHRSGDEGSGYWIGKQIIKTIFRMEDGRGPDTALKEKVFEQLGKQTINDFTGWLYGEEYSVDAIASFSTLLDEAVNQGDQEANRILYEAVDELTNLTTSVIHSAKLNDAYCTIYLNGGTIKNFDKLFYLLKTEVEKKDTKKKVVLCNAPPIEAIYTRALVRFEELVKKG